MYSVLLERSAEKELDALPPRVFSRVVARIKALRTDPRPPGCRNILGSDADWRIRVGDYRVICEIDDDECTVRIMRVRQRSRAYR